MVPASGTVVEQLLMSRMSVCVEMKEYLTTIGKTITSTVVDQILALKLRAEQRVPEVKDVLLNFVSDHVEMSEYPQRIRVSVE